MSNKKVNLEEILSTKTCCTIDEDADIDDLNNMWYNHKSIIEAMLEFGKQLLELAAENAETEKEILPECGVLKSVGVVNKQSILDTINQVE